MDVEEINPGQDTLHATNIKYTKIKNTLIDQVSPWVVPHSQRLIL